MRHDNSASHSKNEAASLFGLSESPNDLYEVSGISFSLNLLSFHQPIYN